MILHRQAIRRKSDEHLKALPYDKKFAIHIQPNQNNLSCANYQDFPITRWRIKDKLFADTVVSKDRESYRFKDYNNATSASANANFMTTCFADFSMSLHQILTFRKFFLTFNFSGFYGPVSL